MSVALDIRLWFDDDACDVASRFGSLLECVGAWPPVGARSWQRVVVRDSVGGRLRADHPAGPDGWSVVDVRRLASDWTSGDVQLSTFTSARTNVGPQADPNQVTDVPLTVEAWGPGWIDRGAAFGPRGLVGDAAVWLHRCWPWLAREGSAAATEAVEQNLDELTALVLALVDQLEPAALKVFTDVAPYLPLDAHATYVRDPASVVDDIRLIAQAWTEGVPGIEPLARARPETAFHEWRGREASAQLHAALGRVIDTASAVTPDTVETVLRSGRFATHDCPRGGVVVLDYPHVLNGYLDTFYLAVLEAAAG